MSSAETPIKILVMGTESSGKTRLGLRFCEDMFVTSNAVQDLDGGRDQRTIEMGGSTYKLRLWESTKEYYDWPKPRNIESVNLLVIVLDLSKTKDEIKADFEESKRIIAPAAARPTLVAGAKWDLVPEPERDAKSKQLSALAAEITAPHVVAITSAKTGQGVEEAFGTAIRELLSPAASSSARPRVATVVGRETELECLRRENAELKAQLAAKGGKKDDSCTIS